MALHLLRKVLVVHPGVAGGFGQLPLGAAQDVLDVALFERGHHALLRIAERKVRVEGSLAILTCRLQSRSAQRRRPIEPLRCPRRITYCTIRT